MIRTGRCLFMAVAMVVVVSGCGGGSAQNPFKAGTTAANFAPHVEVTNNNWLDAVVYATRHGSRVRLGQVTSMSQRLLQVPAGFSGGDGVVGIHVTFVGSSQSFSTDRLYVASNEMIVLDIKNNLETSSWGVYAR